MCIACGVPDFRSPASGLYDNFAQYDLPILQTFFYIRYIHVFIWYYTEVTVKCCKYVLRVACSVRNRLCRCKI